MKPIRTMLAALAAAGLLALTACGGGGNPLTTETTKAGEEPATKAASDTIIVGSANFPEAVLLGEIYAGALSAKGVKVDKKLNIGSRETYIKGLQDGSIDLAPEYTGVLLQYFDKKTKAVKPDEVYAALQKALPGTLTVLEKSNAEDKDAVVVTQETAKKYNLTTIADLGPVAKDLVLGGPPEWKNRQSGVPGLKQVYGLNFKSFQPLDVAGPLTVAALKSGRVDAANLFTTQSAIKANDFVVLEDPKNFFAAQNVVPLISKAKASETVKGALDAVSAKLDTPTLAGLVKEVEVDKKDPAVVAKEWLTGNNLG
ncbi:ABC transporter substrate-binding protein [Actinopolymorpha alba]|uniref:ABC transporter substrate-binding protein n=1 Tax=Actinopolymorpha alba TaxID=533267 RepID=UPI00037D1EC7|nr:ABC transporter substrate-binding protein [Actinopolymorpha alba]